MSMWKAVLAVSLLWVTQGMFVGMQAVMAGNTVAILLTAFATAAVSKHNWDQGIHVRCSLVILWIRLVCGGVALAAHYLSPV